MWAVKITVMNSRTLQQYKVRHTASLQNADIALVYNSSSHYTAAGKCFRPSFCTSDWSLVIKSWDIYVVACRCCSTSYSHLEVACYCKRSLAMYIEWLLVYLLLVRANRELVKDVLTCRPLENSVCKCGWHEF